MSKWILITFLIIISAAAVLFFTKTSTPGNQVSNLAPYTNPSITPPSNYSAKFAIFTNGTFRIFTDKKYHNLSKDYFIESDRPNTLQVRKSGAKWSGFFETLPMKLTHECLTTGSGQTFCSNTNQKLKFYINGKLSPNALDQQIAIDDELLVSYGEEDMLSINEQLKTLQELKN